MSYNFCNTRCLVRWFHNIIRISMIEMIINNNDPFSFAVLNDCQRQRASSTKPIVLWFWQNLTLHFVGENIVMECVHSLGQFFLPPIM